MGRLTPLMSSARTGGRDDWETPEHVLVLVRRLGPIMIDPCAGPTTWIGRVNVTAAQDGLTWRWCRGIAYVNPPYSRLREWAAKVDQEARTGCRIVSLVPSRTDTRWWRTITERASCVLFWRGRIRFAGAASCAPFPSAIIAHGLPPHDVSAAFGLPPWRTP